MQHENENYIIQTENGGVKVLDHIDAALYHLLLIEKFWLNYINHYNEKTLDEEFKESYNLIKKSNAPEKQVT